MKAMKATASITNTAWARRRRMKASMKEAASDASGDAPQSIHPILRDGDHPQNPCRPQTGKPRDRLDKKKAAPEGGLVFDAATCASRPLMHQNEWRMPTSAPRDFSLVAEL